MSNFPGALQIDSVQYISSEYTKQIPGIAYQVPDIDAVVKLVVKERDSGDTLSCLQANFSNGKTISQTGVKWATACIAGLGLIVAAMLSTLEILMLLPTFRLIHYHFSFISKVLLLFQCKQLKESHQLPVLGQKI